MPINITLPMDRDDLIEQLIRAHAFQIVTGDTVLKEDAEDYMLRIWSVPMELSDDSAEKVQAQLDFRANNAGGLSAVQAVVEIGLGVEVRWTQDASSSMPPQPGWVWDLLRTAKEQLKGSNAGGYSSTKPEAYRQVRQAVHA